MNKPLIIVKEEDGEVRVGYTHRVETVQLGKLRGIRMSLIPDPKGKYFTTIATINHHNGMFTRDQQLAYAVAIALALNS